MPQPTTRCVNCNASLEASNVCSACARGVSCCCSCFECAIHGGVRHNSNDVAQCRNCHSCRDGCACRHCESCESFVPTDQAYCDNGHCRRCCQCQETQGLAFIRATEPIFHTGTLTALNPSTRFIAAELEVAEVRNGSLVTAAVRKWQGAIVHDGSIRGNLPFEINTAPASGNKFQEQITEICKALKDSQGVVNDSCGLHVHVDARDFTFYDVRKMVQLYAKIEDALFRIVPPGRRANTRYCAPCGPQYVKDLERHAMPQDNKKKIMGNVYGGDRHAVRRLSRDKYNQARYKALNIHSWLYRGTLESRMHSGTIIAEKIINWGILWAAILDTAIELTDREIRDIKGDSMGILLSITPNATIKQWVIDRFTLFNGANAPTQDNE
jgi:hypothetical protein